MSDIRYIPADGDLDSIFVSGFYRLHGTAKNVPCGCNWGTLITSCDGDTALQIVSDHGNVRFFKRTYHDASTWTNWVSIATATPPEEIPLQLAEGWQIKNYAKFWKNQFGEVSLFFRVGKATGETAQGTIATLPAGFRPAVPVHAAAVTYPGLHPALLVIGSDGTVMVFCNNVESSAEGSFCGSATFVAAP